MKQERITEIILFNIFQGWKRKFYFICDVQLVFSDFSSTCFLFLALHLLAFLFLQFHEEILNKIHYFNTDIQMFNRCSIVSVQHVFLSLVLSLLLF